MPFRRPVALRGSLGYNTPYLVRYPKQVMGKGHVFQLFSPEPADVSRVIAGHDIAGHDMGQEIMDFIDLVRAVRKIERPHLVLDGHP